LPRACAHVQASLLLLRCNTSLACRVCDATYPHAHTRARAPPSLPQNRESARELGGAARCARTRRTRRLCWLIARREGLVGLCALSQSTTRAGRGCAAATNGARFWFIDAAQRGLLPALFQPTRASMTTSLSKRSSPNL
jgi:hypothetical protein